MKNVSDCAEKHAKEAFFEENGKKREKDEDDVLDKAIWVTLVG